MECYKCNIGVQDSILYRANPKGETPAIWACEKCKGDVDTELKKACHQINHQVNHHLN